MVNILHRCERNKISDFKCLLPYYKAMNKIILIDTRLQQFL
jgi:hypothetical protein